MDRVQGNLVLPAQWFDNYAIGYNCRVNVPIPDYLTSTGQPNADYYMAREFFLNLTSSYSDSSSSHDRSPAPACSPMPPLVRMNRFRMVT